MHVDTDALHLHNGTKGFCKRKRHTVYFDIVNHDSVSHLQCVPGLETGLVGSLQRRVVEFLKENNCLFTRPV